MTPKLLATLTLLLLITVLAVRSAELGRKLTFDGLNSFNNPVQGFSTKNKKENTDEGSNKEHGDFLNYYYGTESNKNSTENDDKNSGGNENTESAGPTSDIIEDHWTRLKLILMNMKSVLKYEFPYLNAEDKHSFGILDKIINFGDKIENLKSINKKFNNGLLSFISEKWNQVFNTFISGSPVLKSVFSVDPKSISNTLMMQAVRLIGSYLKNTKMSHFQDLDFVVELMKTSGFHDDEISEVFAILGLENIDENNNPAEGRQYVGGSYIPIEKSGGYGHSGGGYGHSGGGYGHSSHGGGYGGGYYMQTIDPYVLLAGLAFASFLAFLLFRLLSQTAAAARGAMKRSLLDSSFNLDMSDVPGVMSNFHNFLEVAESKFGNNGSVILDPIEKFGSSANLLWDNFQADRMERSCVKRYLCDTVQNKVNLDTSETTSDLHNIALGALAQLFGEESGSIMVDQLQVNRMGGHQYHCGVFAPQCDDDTYRTDMKINTIMSSIK